MRQKSSGPGFNCRDVGHIDHLEGRRRRITVGQLAHALSQLCRYTGHTRGHYSVAQHCVLVAGYLRSQDHPLTTVMGGLMHDAAEAYVGDMGAPLKQTLRRVNPAALTALARIGFNVEVALCASLGLDPTWLHLPEVKEVDLRILLDEAEAVFGPKPRDWAIPGGPLRIQVRPWDAGEAEQRFTGLFWELARELGLPLMY